MKISPIFWDGQGQIWRIGSVSIFPTHPRCLRWSTIIPDKWKLKFVPSGTSAMDFAHYQPSKLLGSSLPIIRLWTNFNFWRTFHFSGQIQYRENLGQTCGDYPIYRQNLGRSAKIKIPDRLGFSWRMKTRLIFRLDYQSLFEIWASVPPTNPSPFSLLSNIYCNIEYVFLYVK